ncbi:hypothetical protein [Fischerella sp. PCC 9605]|uniref:hypothetical protein n=1 Tax=Fischerella sp. PCC 9605 TaxID=1173024 RepID=UPI00047D69E1|nr:hypothetical protein [Fischerella sp. PCC 9605]
MQIEADALAHLVNVANGDARSLLNALELAVETTPPDGAGVVRVTLAVAEESIQQRAVLLVPRVPKYGDVLCDSLARNKQKCLGISYKVETLITE